MGRPRRFSDAFVGRQLDELNKYRDNVRNYLNKKVCLASIKARLTSFQISLNNLDLHPELIDKIRLIQPLRVGQPVFGKRIIQSSNLSTTLHSITSCL